MAGAPRFSNTLGHGDYFGEVAFLYRCRRTSTVTSKLYSTLGCVDADTITGLIRDFPELKDHMKKEIVEIYDDDLKLFLVDALRQIDYLESASEEILVQLAYLCVPDIREKGSILYRMDEDVDQQINDELVIVFDGAIELY